MSKIKSKQTLSSFLEELTLNGQFYFTLEEIKQKLPIKATSLSVSLSRLSQKGKVQMVRKGFGLITGHTRGSLHPSYFIDSMMNHLNAKYYVGLLSAASHWGASHQAAMTYFIVADKVIKPISLGRLKIVFIAKRNFDDISEVVKVAGVGGYYLVSSPELTATDLIRFPKKSGHLNNVATVLEDLLPQINLKKLAALCAESKVPTVTLQRLGFIFDKILNDNGVANCIEKALSKRTVAGSNLSVSRKTSQEARAQFPFDEKWKIYINTTVEPD